ncbi:SDR family NAD(P)-dependent oxidoreductase [Schaalia sp. lx-260]|uniref:SDR family NAD(P)-dependent oxidoreductase n=1 Tax=Schaalia sp. lx-260 TaxID=2899082 RepID=UPI001E59CB6B|nr:SDR family NAD(P)-dependent oxidoreductase [Schaalia sp. lx-260]MCD4550309.1 SDR family NAD(P)-dependent oxidoreductase [Schaalia sp. lx-260]
MTHAPEIRGLFLEALGRPVIVRPTDAPAGLTLPDDFSQASHVLAAVELPVVVSYGETAYEVTALSRGEREITGRVALVTGGAQGFGAEIAQGLVNQGCFVYIADLNGEGAAAKSAELGAHATHPITVNVADEDSVAAMVQEIESVTGGLDLVVSNAGIVRAGSVLEQDASAFRLSTDINYVAFFLVTKHLGALLARQHSTAPTWLTDIIQINSKSGLAGSNKNAAYAGSKFGGIGLVQSFALELVEYGVKVNAICPGNFYDGPLWSDPEKGLFVQYLNSGKVPGARTVADVKEFYESKVPMRRGATGIDVLRAIYYIVEQAYETGQAVPVTGGQVMLN